MLIHIHLVYKKRIMNFIVLLLMTRIVKIGTINLKGKVYERKNV